MSDEGSPIEFDESSYVIGENKKQFIERLCTEGPLDERESRILGDEAGRDTSIASSVSLHLVLNPAGDRYLRGTHIGSPDA
jgi:hypothetical protein